MAWHPIKLFWRHHVFLPKFRKWPKFHVNIIISSGLMTIFICKIFMRELTRILETEKVIAWILLNMWRLEPVTDTKVGINVPNKYSFKVISLQVLQLLSDLGKTNKFYMVLNTPLFEGGRRKVWIYQPPPPSQIKVSKSSFNALWFFEDN